MIDKTLLILAAGMGSRFGGLKQTEKFGPNGEFIIDYSIYDAIRCGFNKVVFIIKEENYDLFRETVGKRVESHIKVEYVFQNFDNVPSNIEIPSSRVKPLGTAHAILCAKNVINEPFVIINADDFYGYDAFKVISNFIDENKNNDTAIVGYNVLNTLTENGSVKRGVMKINNNELIKITESTIEIKNGKIISSPLGSEEIIELDENTQVSMNMMAFNPNFMEFIEDHFLEFLENSNLEKDEYLIPDLISLSIKEKFSKVKVINTNAKWVGVTYKEDKESVQEYINSLIISNEYKENLWD